MILVLQLMKISNFVASSDGLEHTNDVESLWPRTQGKQEKTVKKGRKGKEREGKYSGRKGK